MNTPTDSRKDGEPAFPFAYVDGSRILVHPGMDIRDYFAAKATEADVQYWKGVLCQNNIPASREEAKYAYATAMLAARSQPSQLSDTGRKPE